VVACAQAPTGASRVGATCGRPEPDKDDARAATAGRPYVRRAARARQHASGAEPASRRAAQAGARPGAGRGSSGRVRPAGHCLRGTLDGVEERCNSKVVAMGTRSASGYAPTSWKGRSALYRAPPAEALWVNVACRGADGRVGRRTSDDRRSSRLTGGHAPICGWPWACFASAQVDWLPNLPPPETRPGFSFPRRRHGKRWGRANQIPGGTPCRLTVATSS
jgi:hypothetical protein